jgi:hypothetical protein
VSTFRIAGQIDENEFIDAIYSGEAAGGLLALSRVFSNTSSSISSLSGTWVLLDDNQGIDASFSAHVLNSMEASIYGSHVNGCAYSGVAESWTSMDSYDIWELSVEGCPEIGGVDVNGMYSGSAAFVDIEDDSTDGPALVVGLTNDENQLTFVLYRP